LKLLIWEDFWRRMPLGHEVSEPNRVALILSGGGARAAYQVGVLKALAEILPPEIESPFEILCGTSAGAINAALLASRIPYFRDTVDFLDSAWSSFHAGRIYRTQSMALAGNVFRMLMGIIRGGRSTRPISLLDNAPLAEYLANSIDFEHIQEVIDQGDLHALSITAAGYGSGISHTFFQGAEMLEEWRRAKRVGVRAKISLEHLMGSSAIPMVFPAVRIGDQYFGDGAVRQLAPISPAVHLGAHRVFVIGVSQERAWASSVDEDSYPSIAQVTGHVFNSAFLDGMGADIERLERINQMIRLVPDRVRTRDGMTLHPIDFLVISPSESLDAIAARHVGELPRTIQWMLRRGGAVKPNTAPLVSYLLFEGGFCRELIGLGYRDGSAREPEILKFFGR